ncbi:hypothetical protein, partial [Actinotalea sp. C106]|uniref:hypothetical protein n=1 Tax=Actinotalea sp. C106 TaxID=2908644 RepID=UPI0020288F8B
MLWFLVWTALVLGSLVGAFFLLRHVYRSGRALLVEIERAGEVMGAVAERAEELERLALALHPVQPVELSDPEPARARRAAAKLATA